MILISDLNIILLLDSPSEVRSENLPFAAELSGVFESPRYNTIEIAIGFMAKAIPLGHNLDEFSGSGHSQSYTLRASQKTPARGSSPSLIGVVKIFASLPTGR